MGTSSATSSSRKWVVLASSFVSLLLTGFGMNHAGIMKVALLRHFGHDDVLITWLVSYYIAVYALLGPLGSLMLNLTSCRLCVFTSGLLCLLGFVLSSLATDIHFLFFTLTLVGLGQAMSNTGSLIILSFYFPDQTTMVNGVTLAGGALGMFLHPPLMQLLVDGYGLQGALLLSGAVASHSCVCGALMKPARLEKRVTRSRHQGSFGQRVCLLVSQSCSDYVTVLSSWRLHAFLVSNMVFPLATFSVMVIILPQYLITYSGLTIIQASLAQSVFAVGSLLSRLVTGVLSHDSRVGSLLIYCGLSGVSAFISLSAPALLSHGIVGAYAYTLCLGLYTGGCFVLIIPILTEIVGLHHSATAFGFSLFMTGVGAVIGAPLVEFVKAQAQSQTSMFNFAAGLYLLASALAAVVVLRPSTGTTTDHSAQPTDDHNTPSHLDDEGTEEMKEEEKGALLREGVVRRSPQIENEIEGVGVGNQNGRYSQHQHDEKLMGEMKEEKGALLREGVARMSPQIEYEIESKNSHLYSHQLDEELMDEKKREEEGALLSGGVDRRSLQIEYELEGVGNQKNSRHSQHQQAEESIEEKKEAEGDLLRRGVVDRNPQIKHDVDAAEDRVLNVGALQKDLNSQIDYKLESVQSPLVRAGVLQEDNNPQLQHELEGVGDDHLTFPHAQRQQPKKEARGFHTHVDNEPVASSDRDNQHLLPQTLQQNHQYQQQQQQQQQPHEEKEALLGDGASEEDTGLHIEH